MREIRRPLTVAAEEFPDCPALISTDSVVSYREYNAMVQRAASGLTKCGVRESDRVALLGSNSVDYVVTLMALLQIKAVACPISVRLPIYAVKEQVRLAACRYLIDFDDRADSIPPPGVVQIKTDSILGSSTSVEQTDAAVSLDRHATILFTSGSSGTPKAALHSYGNHYYSAAGANRNIPFGPEDRWLLSLPLHHVGGIGVLFRALFGGGAVVISSAAQELGRSILQLNATHVSLVPTQLSRLLQRKDELSQLARRLKAVLLGGGPAPERLIEEALKSGLPLFKSYGLTEMASQVTTTAGNDPPEKLATSGRILDHRELRISSGREILVRGETLFQGYIDGDRLDRPVDNNGWFATGDMGRIDSDGCLVVTGRKDNMFISGGENIQPEEIENALCLLPAIAEALVVPREDSVYGLRPVAFIRYEGHRPHDYAALVSHLENYLPRFKIPDAFHPWPEEPTPGGLKMARARLVKLARRMRKMRG